MSSTDHTAAAPTFWDKLTGHGSSSSHSSTSSSSTHSSSSSSHHSSTAGVVGGGTVVKETTVKETTIQQPAVSSNTSYQYCNDHLTSRELAATCTKCISTTGPMQTMSGTSIVDVNQTAQVHFVGKQTAATLQSESAGVQVQVPAQTITTTLPAKRVVVEVPERQVQVQVPGRTIQLENAPEVQVTTRPVIKAIDNLSISGVTTTSHVGAATTATTGTHTTGTHTIGTHTTGTHTTGTHTTGTHTTGTGGAVIMGKEQAFEPQLHGASVGNNNVIVGQTPLGPAGAPYQTGVDSKYVDLNAKSTGDMHKDVTGFPYDTRGIAGPRGINADVAQAEKDLAAANKTHKST